jgi:signal transduction histidine kinase
MQKTSDQARRAGAIIQRLREFLRQQGPRLADQDLVEIARTAVRLAAPEAREAGIEVSVVSPPGPLSVRVDGLLIEQVVINLVRNGIEAARASASSRRTQVTVATGDNGWASLAVTDWGHGVEASIASRLFEPFVTASPGGLGLGLAISRSVIEAHGGKISHRPNPQGGAIFEVLLPRHA